MNREARSLNLIALRDIIWTKSNAWELAGDAATVLSKLPIKEMRTEMSKKQLINPPAGSREEYSNRALKKVMELAEEFQKEFTQTAGEKFGESGPRPGLN